MLLSYLKLSLRLLARNPFFTFINVAGLSVGFTVFFILWQYSQSELNSDQFHKDWEQIYKIGCTAAWADNGTTYHESVCGANHYGINEIVAKYAEVIDRTDFFAQKYFSQPGSSVNHTQGHGSNIIMSYVDEEENRHSFIETKVIYAEPNFFNFFSIPFILGDKQNALKLPEAVVISENIAIKYFGSHDVIGKTLYINNVIPLQVTGVFENLPKNTHLDFDIAISTQRIRSFLDQLPDADRFFSFSYCKLHKGIDIEELQNKTNSQSGDKIRKMVWGSWSKGKAEIFFQPLQEVAFEAFRFDTHKSKSKFLLYTFAVASLVILAMAWINHVNLALSSNSKRLKELATRKTVGASAGDFATQFMIEVIVINLISFLLAMTLVQLLKSPADIFLQFHIPDWGKIPLSTWLILTSALLSGVFLTGFYLAIISLKRSPKSLFLLNTGKYNNSGGIGILSIIQFASTSILVIWIFTFHSQLTFIFNKDIGLNREQVVLLDLPITPTENFWSDIERVVQSSNDLEGIKDYTVSSSVSADYWSGTIYLSKEERSGRPIESNGGVDENFIPFYGIKILAGRNFLPDKPSDRNAILISRGAMLRLGINKPEEAIGQKLLTPKCEIIGVFEDYNLRPFIKNDEITYDGIPGIALTYKNFLLQDLTPKRISLRVSPDNFNETMGALEKNYHSVFPESVFNWYFLDDQINNQYQSEKTARNQILFFSLLAISIACLGLLGMISNKVVEKTKEIGIRKVLGAELHQIAQILLNTTVKQIIIATVIGIPVAYYLTQQYLQKFSERIELEWWHFALPVVMLVVIMFATVASMLWKAAKSNPVEALRTE